MSSGIKGPPAKKPEDRIRRNKPAYSEIPVEWDGVIRGPALPKRWAKCQCKGFTGDPHPKLLPPKYCEDWVEIEWHPMTVEWYNAWRETPQSMVFTETDWMFFAETALLHEEYWSENNKKAEMVALAGELRRRQEAYGGTFQARRQLRMEVDSPAHRAGREAKIDHEAKSAVDYAEKLTEYASKWQGLDD